MNLLSGQFLFSIIILIVTGISVYHRNPRQRINRFFAILCMVFAFWSFIQFGFAQCRNFEEAVIWKKLFSVWPLVMAITIHFIFAFTEKTRVLKSVWTRTAIYGPALIFSVSEATVGLLHGSPLKHTSGWVMEVSEYNPAFVAGLVWLVVAVVLMVSLIVHYFLTVTDSRKRNQVRLFLLSLILTSAATLFESFLAFFSVPFPRITPVTLAMGCFIIGYAMWKYSMFALTPMTAAESIVSTMTDMLFLTDMEGRILTANSAAHWILGYAEDELVGRRISALFRDGTDQPEWLTRVLSGKENSAYGITDAEVSFNCKSKRIVPASLAGTLVRDKDGTARGVLLIGRNIAARKQAEQERNDLEAKYQQAQKLESIGRLAGGIAHDMNNILGAIMASASVLEEGKAPKNPDREDIECILAACRRGRDLTRNLLGFARKGKYIKESISFNDLVEETAAILKRTVSKKIDIEMHLDENLALFEGDYSQIQSALMNVCVNATDAISSAGTVKFSTENVVLDETLFTSSGRIEPGEYVRLQVSDTGTGMDPDTAKMAFEPFFTTKPMGEGTGLGLSMVYGVIANHGGAVTIYSKLNRGTTITFHLPAHGDAAR